MADRMTKITLSNTDVHLNSFDVCGVTVVTCCHYLADAEIYPTDSNC